MGTLSAFPRRSLTAARKLRSVKSSVISVDPPPNVPNPPFALSSTVRGPDPSLIDEFSVSAKTATGSKASIKHAAIMRIRACLGIALDFLFIRSSYIVIQATHPGYTLVYACIIQINNRFCQRHVGRVPRRNRRNKKKKSEPPSSTVLILVVVSTIYAAQLSCMELAVTRFFYFNLQYQHTRNTRNPFLLRHFLLDGSGRVFQSVRRPRRNDTRQSLYLFS